jgi:hypothetical protein
MYSNIPTSRAIQFITEHLRRTAHQFNNVPVEALCEALRIIMTSNVFTFGDTFWKQFKGTAMGKGPVIFQMTAKVIVQALRKGKACDDKAWKYNYFKDNTCKGMACKGNAS